MTEQSKLLQQVEEIRRRAHVCRERKGRRMTVSEQRKQKADNLLDAIGMEIAEFLAECQCLTNLTNEQVPDLLRKLSDEWLPSERMIKKPYYKLTHGGNWCVYTTIDDCLTEAKDFLEEGALCKMTIEVVELTDEEFEALGEFPGW